jgi:hypothetical protein
LRSGSQRKLEKNSGHPCDFCRWQRLAAKGCRALLLLVFSSPAAVHAEPDKVFGPIAEAPASASFSAPMGVPQLQYEAAPVVSADQPGFPALLRPDTSPDPEPARVPPPVLATSAPTPEPAAGNCIKRDEEGRLIGWMDYQQCVFSGRTLASAIWVDDLFGDWHDKDAMLLVRAITEITTTEAQGSRFRFRLRASAALPNAQKRLRLVVTDDSEVDQSVGGQDVLSQLDSARDKLSTALRWVPFERAGFQSDFDIGIRGLGPMDIFTRARLRKSWNVSRDGVIRFGETLRYGSESHGRSITQMDYEYALGQTALARLSSAYEYQQDHHDNGLLWGHGISMSHMLGGPRSLGYGFSVNGHTQPNWKDENYGPWLLYRSNLLRPWLFYELEPRVTWYGDGGGDAVLSLTLRLELQLGKKK